MNQLSATPCVVATPTSELTPLESVAARSLTPPPAVVLVKRTFDPSATPVVQPEKLPEKAKFETAFGAPPLERLAKALATSAAETEPDA